MNTNLYNNDGTLSTQAQSLLSSRPADMSMGEWKKIIKEFKSQLSEQDVKEFARLKRKALRKAVYQKNRKKDNARSRAYHEQHKEERRAYNRAYHEQHKEERRAYMAEYARNRRHKDPLYNFFHNIRSQAVRVVKQVGLGKKPTNTFKWVGCSPEELKAHIESLFQEGMTWNNYGKHGWHVDHIRPVSSFKPEEWDQINHYTNLQPLWAEDNISKSNKY